MTAAARARGGDDEGESERRHAQGRSRSRSCSLSRLSIARVRRALTGWRSRSPQSRNYLGRERERERERRDEKERAAQTAKEISCLSANRKGERGVSISKQLVTNFDESDKGSSMR